MADNYEYSRAEMRRGDNPVGPELLWLMRRVGESNNLNHDVEFQNRLRAYKAKTAEEKAADAAAAKAGIKQEGGRRRSRRGGRRTRRVTRRRRTSRR